jgi:hypothetical protein
MALKILKATVVFDVKGDKNDPEDLRERVLDKLHMLIESDEIEFSLDEDEEEVEDES